MLRTIADFKENWTYEYESTIKLFEQISDDLMNKKIHDDVRSLATLAWHLTITIGEMPGKAGLKVNCADEHSKPPAHMKEIISAYKTAAESVMQEAEKNWSDKELETKVEMYGEKWAKGRVLDILIAHQAHHRGQMSVIMRVLGMKVPGVYGPSKEEWAQWGMPAME